MKKTTLTVIEVYKENATDIYPIYQVGFDKKRVISDALNDMKYSCCKDHTDPSSMKDGYTASIGTLEAFEIDPEADEDDIAEELGCLYIEKVKAEGKTFAVTNDELDSGTSNGFGFTSDEIKKMDSWSDIYEYLIERYK